MNDWELLGERDPTLLVDATLQAHWAVQTIASVGMTFVETLADDGHTTMEWNAGRRLLTGHFVTENPCFQLALDPASLSLILLDLEGDEIGWLELAGCTLDQTYEWLSTMVGTFIEDDSFDFLRPSYDMPDHPVGTDAPFELTDPAYFVEVARWFANADSVLRVIQGKNDNASPVRCWPHHFDLATRIDLDPNATSDAARSIRVGMTLGDSHYPEPYFYVTPWPYPDTGHDELQVLEAGGVWHTDDWVGAVLTGTVLVEDDSSDVQMERCVTFIESALKGCRELLSA